MRPPVDRQKLAEVRRALGRSATSGGRIFFAGGATALDLGWRDTTLDIDLSMAPEPGGVFGAIAELKQRLGVNIELADPRHFVPALCGWERRCIFIERVGEVEFFHLDPYTQALSKLARGFEKDLRDVRAMVGAELVVPAKLVELYSELDEELLRYPALDRSGLTVAVLELAEDANAGD